MHHTPPHHAVLCLSLTGHNLPYVSDEWGGCQLWCVWSQNRKKYPLSSTAGLCGCLGVFVAYNWSITETQKYKYYLWQWQKLTGFFLFYFHPFQSAFKPAFSMCYVIFQWDIFMIKLRKRLWKPQTFASFAKRSFLHHSVYFIFPLFHASKIHPQQRKSA